MKKSVFGISFDPTQAAGAESRLGNHSLDKFFGDGKIIYPRDPVDTSGRDKDPAKKFKTYGLAGTLPSVILRKKGVKP